MILLNSRKLRLAATPFIAFLFIMHSFCFAEPKQKMPISPFDQVASPIIFQATDGYVTIQGRWKKTSGNFFKPHRINTVSIICNHDTMICREIIAELLTPKEAADLHFEKPKLFIDETDYKIVSWSNDIITAQYLAPVADFELRVSIKDGLAERRWRETKARGAETSNPNNFGQWILE